MRNFIVRQRSFAAVTLILATVTTVAAAQGFPTRPIRVVVGLSPGSGVDVAARILGQKLAERWGQQVVVDNRAGAGTNIAMDIVAKATPDGYTLLANNNSVAINATLYRKLAFDPLKDLIPVSQTAASPQVLVANPALPAATVQELVALAKSRPDQLNLASAGSGSPSHLAGELFKAMAGIRMTHVPYKGGPPALADVVGGAVSLYVSGMPPALPLIKAGRVKALAVTSLQRTASLPGVPTFAESGLPGYEANLWYGVFAPAGTSRRIVALLNDEIGKLLPTTEIRERYTAIGIEPAGGSVAAFEKFVRAEAAKWGKVIRDGGIRAD
jgi:tripartite-type tricarboxylate transporter receptor subunit TctC